jgi:CP family cyanate transporter-like MFS transporter
VVLPLFGGSWEQALAFWSAPVFAIALLVLVLAPARRNGTATARPRWWPDWRNLLIWRLGFMLGTVNAMYFTSNAFIPDFLRAHGQGDWISAALTGLNAGQLPASFLLLAFASRLELKAWPIVGCGALCAIGTVAFIFGSPPVMLAGISLLGFASAAILVLVLALPPMLAAPDDVHRVTAAMFTISYSCAVGVPVVSGALWDMTAIPGFAFAPVGIAAVLLMLLAPAINHVRRPGS